MIGHPAMLVDRGLNVGSRNYARVAVLCAVAGALALGWAVGSSSLVYGYVSEAGSTGAPRPVVYRLGIFAVAFALALLAAAVRPVAGLAAATLATGAVFAGLSGAVPCTPGCPLPPYQHSTPADLVHAAGSIAALGLTALAMLALAVAATAPAVARRISKLGVLAGFPLITLAGLSIVLLGRGLVTGVAERLALLAALVWLMGVPVALAYRPAVGNDRRVLSTTRRAWHAVGELVLAGPQHRRSGTIRLRVTPDGFATTKEPALAVAGDVLVSGEQLVGLDGRSCAQLGECLGVDVGAPLGLYSSGSGADPEQPLRVDAGATAELAQYLWRADRALREFGAGHEPVLWPEHFDVGIVVDEVNYGVSLGDEDYLDEPYAYVGPHEPRTGEFWNAPFGAARPLRAMPEQADLVAFFDEGRRLSG